MVTGLGFFYIVPAVGATILSVPMVMLLQSTGRIVCPAKLLLAQQQVEPVLEQLDPPRRAAVVMALLGLVLTGLLLVTIVMVGAHWVRRLARHQPGNGRSGKSAEAAAKNPRLRESLEPILPEAASGGDTIHLDSSSKETKMDS